jgi:hypothetical protein
VTTREHEPPDLLCALESARALGCADGRIAGDLEPDGEPVAVGPWCHGLDPDDFACLVWGAGSAPAGVRLNAPLWYALGFREGLASARAQRGGRVTARHPLPAAPERAPAPLRHRPPEDTDGR